MRGLSLTQPWASLVAIGAKRVETRSWPARYAGPVAIQASLKFPPSARDLCDSGPFRGALAAGGYRRLWDDRPDLPPPEGSRAWAAILPLGAVVAVATLAWVGRIGVHTRLADNLYSVVSRAPMVLGDDGMIVVSGNEVAFGNYEPGRWGWVLTDVRRLPDPVPCRGALGLWTVPVDVAARLAAQLEKGAA